MENFEALEFADRGLRVQAITSMALLGQVDKYSTCCGASDGLASRQLNVRAALLGEVYTYIASGG